MIGDTYHNTETNIYNAPCLCIPLIDGLIFPSNTGPDAGVSNGVCIYLHLTAATGPASENLQQTTVLPIVTEDGLSYGGQSVMLPPKIQPRVSLEGHIDTPSYVQGDNYIPFSGTPGGGTTTVYTSQTQIVGIERFIYSYNQNVYALALETIQPETSHPLSIATTGTPTTVLVPESVPIPLNPYNYAEILIMMLEGRANYGGSDIGWGRLDPLWYRDPWGRVYNSPRILDFTGSYVVGVPQRTQFTMALKI